ncbi:MAG: Ig-like domain-containing protein, partial [Wenzhouxiangellaceae bacterium]
EVVDIRPPVIVPPPDIVEVGTGSVSNLGQPLVFDFVDLDPVIGNDAVLPLTTGLHEITWTATDASGNSDSAVQIVNIKNSNASPTALSQTGPDRQVAVSFEPQTIRLEGSDPDADPLTFYVEQYPQDGFFVAPLYPYFIEDYRLQQSVADAVLTEECTNGDSAPSGNFDLEFPSEPSYITVADQGDTFVVDKGYVQCSAQAAGNFRREQRIARFNPDGSLHSSVHVNGFDFEDVVFDVDNDVVVATSVNSAGDSFIRVYDLDFNEVRSYGLTDIDDTDGDCGTFGTGSFCHIQRAKSAVLDETGLLYVMERTGRIYALDAEQSHPTVFIDHLSDDVTNDAATNVDADSLAVDSKGFVYASRNDRIYKYEPARLNSEGQVVPGDPVGWMGRCDIDAAPGDAAVCDTHNRRSIGYSCTDETCLIDEDISLEEKAFCGWTFSNVGHSGCRPGQFRGPRGIDIDPRDNLYVADLANERIQRFTPDGFFAGEAESSCDGSCFVLGDFGKPKDVSVNSDHFYILDPDTNLLHVSLLTPFTEIGPDYAELVYQSNNDFACADSADCIDAFAFSVSDGVRHSDTGLPIRTAPADVEVEVMRNFRPPVATPGIAVLVDEDTPTPITLDGSDLDPLDTLSFAIDQQPEHGTINVDGNQATYTPDTNYYGSDAFSFNTSDGDATSAAEEVIVTVVEVNDPADIHLPDPATVGVGFVYRLAAEFVDPDPDEQHLVAVDWGDGTVEFETDVEGNGPQLGQSGNGPGTIRAEHIYSSPGTYTVEVCLTDRVTGDDGSEVPTPESLTSCDSFPVEAIDGLDLVMSAVTSTERALPNQLVSILFRALNNPPAAGPPSTATGVELVVELPEGLAPGSISLSGTGCVLNDLRVTCSVGTLNPGFAGFTEITARVDGASLPGTALAFEARASADQVDVNPHNAIAHVINVSQPADLYVDAVDDAFRDKPDIDPGDGVCESEDGVCTLRAAIEEANAQPGLRAVALGTGVYTLDDQIEISDDLVLVGNGAANSIIDGSDNPHSFLVSTVGVTLRIEDLTVARGRLTVAQGDLVVRRSRFTGANSPDGVGGAIQAGDLIDIRDTTFDENRSASGAAVWGHSGSHGVFENVTVVGHTGGGLALGGTDYTLNHVTMTGNLGDSGAASGVAGGALTLFGNATATITGSILAGNYPVGNGVIDRPINCAVGTSATLISGGDNVLGDLDGCDLAAGPTDILVPDTDTGLRPLRFAAGSLPFVPPAPGSPAVDAVLGPDCPLVDALGVLRPVDGDGDGVADCDMGAIELVPDLTPPQLDVPGAGIDFGEVAPGN